VRIGSHSVSHPNFRLLDDEQARRELAESKADLEKITGRQVRSFSFPHGAYTARCLTLARQCGYAQVYTIAPGLTKAPRDEFIVGRVCADPSDWPIEFRLKALGAYLWMVWASAFKRGLRNRLHGRHRQVQAARVA
jgi:peptidoglycan/xylan/chitin deacetylase (PgdA/CDA1 family)